MWSKKCCIVEMPSMCHGKPSTEHSTLRSQSFGPENSGEQNQHERCRHPVLQKRTVKNISIQTQPQSSSDLQHIYEQKYKHYQKVRERIYSEENTNFSQSVNKLSENLNRSPVARKNKMVRCRLRYKHRKKLRRSINALIKTDNAQDNRHYADVWIGGEKIKGLLDSGASVSCLGKNSEAFVTRLGLKIQCNDLSIGVADARPLTVVGTVVVPVTFNNKTKTLTLYIVPSLSQTLYLGIDFWNEFDIRPKIISEISTPVDSAADQYHVLSNDQGKHLECVKALFPSFAVLGLEKTSLEEHVIDKR